MLPLLALSVLAQRDEPPAAPREFRAVWVATVDNIDWPSKKGLTTDQARAELVKILDTSERLNVNALVFQIRPHADALYDSKIEPWSEYLTGEQGKAPNPYWDPLSFMVEEGHKRGIEIHAWVNPYRAWHSVAKSAPAPNYIGRTDPGLVKQYGKFQWMDPGEKKVQDRTLAVMLDVVERYDIDGIHIDDYFYPYKSYANGADFPDGPSWQKYVAAGGKLGRADWRRQNVDVFVRRAYTEIKKAKRWVKFGISPFGIYRPGHPSDVKTSFDQYETLYADARKWLVEGWCDYYTPQLYWRVKGDQPYGSLLRWWSANNPKMRHLWPGLFTGRVSSTDGNWPAQEIVDQIELTRASRGEATGHVHFSAKSLMGNWKAIADTLRNGIYKQPALVPASTWLDKEAPKQPNIRFTGTAPNLVANFDSPESSDVRWFAYYVKKRGLWTLVDVVWARSAVRPLNLNSMRTEGVTAIAVAAVDKYGNESARYVHALRG